jgi:cytochrome P450
MADGSINLAKDARERAWATPLDQFQVADIDHFVTDTHWPWFERLRAEDPVHYTAESEFGPYWSVTRFNDIIAVDGNHEVFSSSSELGGITIFDGYESSRTTSFIGLDPPQHDAERKVVTPMFSSAGIQAMAPLIRERAAKILDELPVGETFDFVDKVSIELTSQMLATLFNFPFEDRRLLPRASDLILMPPPDDAGELEARQTELMGIFTRFVPLWIERKAAASPADDLISLLAHGAATTSDNPEEFFGNLVLLVVAGSDTTRHSISGALLALNENPDQYQRLRETPALLETAVPEIIRWQTPVAHMRRTALADYELSGKTIRKGEKVIMWYVSGNRDDTVIENPDAFVIDRARPRQHVSFGFGVHRCVGNRLAEMQLRIVWEEILKRFPRIEIVGDIRRLRSNFVKGYEAMPVRIVA